MTFSKSESDPNPPRTVAGAVATRLSAEAVVRCDEPLAPRTTLRVGGKADLYVEPASESDLAAVLGFCAELGLPVCLLGRGSNLLVRDGGVRGAVVCLAHPAFGSVAVEGERLRCGAGARLKQVAVAACHAGLGGLEFLEGIPGSVGGALRMNAGAMRRRMFDVVEQVRFMDYHGRVEERNGAEVKAGYRGCAFFREHIALGAVLRGCPAPREEIQRCMAAFNEKRRAIQPPQPSAGCVFKNPPELPAGRLIDQLGLKGTRVGGAMVSPVHANFIVNDGAATARDVLALIGLIQERVRAARGAELEMEVEVVGED